MSRDERLGIQGDNTMISFTTKGDFRHLEKLLKNCSNGNVYQGLEQYAQKGVEALASATPKDSGKTAESWGYEIHRSGKQIEIVWTNNNINDGVNIAVILQYGHGTRNGGYVVGRDYINPAMRPVFDEIAEAAWKEVTGL